MRVIHCKAARGSSSRPPVARIAEAASSKGDLIFAPTACRLQSSGDSAIALRRARVSPPVCR